MMHFLVMYILGIPLHFLLTILLGLIIIYPIPSSASPPNSLPVVIGCSIIELLAAILVSSIIWRLLIYFASIEPLPPAPTPPPAAPNTTVDLSGFVRLPEEMRILIWDEVAASEPGRIEILYNNPDATSRISPIGRQPVVSQVTQSSRARLQDSFVSPYPNARYHYAGHRTPGTPVLFSPLGDTLRLWEAPTQWNLRNFAPFSSQFAHVRSIELLWAPDPRMPTNIPLAFAPFLRLRQITILDHELDRNYYLNTRKWFEDEIEHAWVSTVNPARAANVPRLDPVSPPRILYRARKRDASGAFVPDDHGVRDPLWVSLGEGEVLERLFRPGFVVPGAFPEDEVSSDPPQQQNPRRRFLTAGFVGRLVLFLVTQYLFWDILLSK